MKKIMMSLKGKTILLIMPRFFGYQEDIIKDLESRGGKVSWIVDRPYDKPFQLLLTRLFPWLMLQFTALNFKKSLSSLKTKKIDIVLAIDPVTLLPASVISLKKKFPSARYVLYLWDSVNNRKHLQRLFSLFDKNMSFDPSCSKKYNLKYRPLFYRDMLSSKEQKYDVSFVGTIHSDRYHVLKGLISVLPSSKDIYFYFYIHAKWLYFLFKLTKKSFSDTVREDFNYIPLSKDELHDVFLSSKVIVDVEHPNQEGLTMRTLEALGAEKKLITTNANIINHDFYNPQNICVISRTNPVVPEGFFCSPYAALPNEIYEKYSISGWLDELLM